MKEIEIFKDFLRQKKLRLTAQRTVILRAFLALDGHVDAEQLLVKAQEADQNIGIATVYRTLNLLAQCGLIKRNKFSGGKAGFEKAYRRSHHDHLICTCCRRALGFEHPMIEKLQREVARDHDFSLESHRMEIYGICRACQKALTGASPRRGKSKLIH